MLVIVPCCGQSSRFPGTPPKWMLPAPDGRPMVALAVEGLEVDAASIAVVILREHEERFAVSDGLRRAIGPGVRTVILDESTSSQVETVSAALERLGVREPFLVKDSDGTFCLSDLEQPTGYVSVESLSSFDSVNARNKSYVEVDSNGMISNIREKDVISDLFSVGGYYFTDPEAFIETHRALASDVAAGELHVSDVIASLLLGGAPFAARRVTGYRDWGTVHEWRHALLDARTLFVLVDGFLLERGSEYFAPTFEHVQPNPRAVEAVQEAARRGRSVVYLSIRPAALRGLTETQLLMAGVPQGQLVFDCPLTGWTLVGAPEPSLPFTTVHALELSADDPNVVEKLLDDR